MMENAPQQSTNQRDDLTNKEKEYDRAISLMQYHTGLLWQEFSTFLLAETVLIGLLGTTLAQTKAIVGPNTLVFSGSILGLFLCIPWYATFRHNYEYYLLRIEQAKRLESALGITLLSEGQKLSSGATVNINGTKLQFPPLARHLPPRRSVRLLIILFGIAFLALVVITRPW